MSSEAEAGAVLQVAHVLSMDVVAYSTLLINEQKQVIEELGGIVRSTVAFRRSEADGRLLRLPTGDGMLLVFFDHPQAPLECAIEIAEALRSRPQIQLRMGIHSGPVNAVTDLNESR